MFFITVTVADLTHLEGAPVWARILRWNFAEEPGDSTTCVVELAFFERQCAEDYLDTYAGEAGESPSNYEIREVPENYSVGV